MAWLSGLASGGNINSLFKIVPFGVKTLGISCFTDKNIQINITHTSIYTEAMIQAFIKRVLIPFRVLGIVDYDHGTHFISQNTQC